MADSCQRRAATPYLQWLRGPLLSVNVGQGGNTHSGSFTLDFYDPSGNFVMEVPGSVTGERISVE